MYYIVGLRDTLRECLDYVSVLLDSPKMNTQFNYSTHNLTSSLSDMADSGVPGGFPSETDQCSTASVLVGHHFIKYQI